MVPEAFRTCALWSADEEAQLVRLYRDTVPASRIAKTLGRTVEAIQTRAYRLGLISPLAGRNKVTCPAEIGDHHFEDMPASALHAELRIIGRHLPPRPLPGSTGSAAALCMEG